MIQELPDPEPTPGQVGEGTVARCGGRDLRQGSDPAIGAGQAIGWT
jgi:hypothetical protein